MATRKFESGYSKLQKKRRRVELFVESHKWAMDKFIKINKKNELENTGESSLNEEHNNINLGEDNNVNIGEDNNKVVNEDNNFDYQTQDNNFDSQTNDSNSNLKLKIMRTKLQDKIIIILKIYTIQSNGKILIQN